jgi:hypothetical protein
VITVSRDWSGKTDKTAESGHSSVSVMKMLLWVCLGRWSPNGANGVNPALK